MKNLKSKVATVVFELIGCADSEMNAVFCEGVLVVGADAGGSCVSQSHAGSRTLGCWCCCVSAVGRFFVEDGMVAGNVAVENSCWRVVKTENALVHGFVVAQFRRFTDSQVRRFAGSQSRRFGNRCREYDMQNRVGSR